MLTGKDYDDYIAGAIKEMRRVERECPGFTYADYQELCVYPYRGETIRTRTGLKLNEAKELAGISIRIQRGVGSNNKHNKNAKRTKRNCNMRDENHNGKDKWFMAEDNMFSCPSCTNLKKHSEAFSGGLDEAGLGTLGGINR